MLKRPAEEYDGYRDAGIRLSEPLLPSLEKHGAGDVPAVRDGIRAFDKAHLVMLVEEGLVDRPAGNQMLAALRHLEHHDAEGGKHAGERQMIRQFGQDVGGQLHLGRSSGDLGAVSRRLAIRSTAIAQMEALLKIRRASLDVGRKHVDTVMPGSTHLQHGQPTTFGHWSTMWNQVFGRDFDRSLSLVHRVNGSPAGAAIMTGSDFPLDRERTARLLGFDHVLPHTLDAVQSTDDLFDAAAVVAITAADLERVASDLQLFFSSEFGYLDVPDRYCGTSSIMMQKRNPAWMGRAKGVGGQALGALVAAVAMGNGPTGVPIEERNMAEPVLFGTWDALTARLDEGAELLRAVVPDVARLAELAGRHWAAATDLAGTIVRERDLDWRSAHQIVGVVVRLCEERRIAPSSLTPEILDEASTLYMDRPLGLEQAQIDEALDPRACIARRTGIGGPSPETHLAQIAEDLIMLDQDQRRLDALKARLAAAARELESAIDTILGVPFRSDRAPITVGQSPGFASTCCG
jgi:argininosuccinate lyase